MFVFLPAVILIFGPSHAYGKVRVRNGGCEGPCKQRDEETVAVDRRKAMLRAARRRETPCISCSAKGSSRAWIERIGFGMTPTTRGGNP